MLQFCLLYQWCSSPVFYSLLFVLFLFLKVVGGWDSKRGWNRFFVIDFRIEVILIDAIVLEKNELEKESFLDSECHRGSEKHLLDLASYSARKFLLVALLMMCVIIVRDENF